MTARGRQLELAVKRAAVDYRKARRCVLLQQYPRTATGRDGELIYAGSAPADFLGAIASNVDDARALAVECKEVNGSSLPLSRLDDEQRMALDVLHQLGALVYLVVDFVPVEEVYVIDWRHVAEFRSAPWRESLSLAFCRAHGLLVPEVNRDGKAGYRRALFLDGKEHPLAEAARRTIAAERDKAQAGAGRVGVDAAAETPARPSAASKRLQQRMATRPAPGSPEHGDYLRGLVVEGLGNQLSRKRRGWKGRRAAR